jgi:molybdenum cofactor cytidylyltransferase
MIFNCSVIILAGGESLRMGKPKQFLLYNEITFLEQIYNVYNSLNISEIIITTNTKYYIETQKLNLKNAKIIKNDNPEWGRFHSLFLAANHLKNNYFVFIQNVDNPFVNVEVLKLLFSNIEKNSYCVPIFENKGGHPILISNEIVTQIQNENVKNLNLKEFLKPYNRKNVITNDKNILTNINTIDEYNKLKI